MSKHYSLIPMCMFFLTTTACVSTEKNANSHKLVIIHTNDHHGHPLAFDEYPGKNVGGLPARKTYIDNLRSSSENLLVLDAGDLNTGRPESTSFKAEPDIIGYNDIGYDAMTIGNHEFDNTLEVFKKQMSQAKFPFLSANIKTKDGKFLAKPYIIKSMDGFKVGIFGLTTSETKYIGNPDVVKNLIIEDEIIAAKNIVFELKQKEKVDIVIALVHMGIYPDNTKGSKLLAEKLKGIDLIIDGHSHTRLSAPIYVNKTPIVQAFNWGIVLGQGEFNISNGKVESFKWREVPINLQEKVTKPDGTSEIKYVAEKIPEDKALLAKLKHYNDKVDKLLSEVIGHNEELLVQKDVRNKETIIGQLVADAMKDELARLKPDFVILNGGGIRASLPAGPITKKIVYDVLPFDNSLVVLTLKGSAIKELCDYTATTLTKGSFGVISEGVEMNIDFSAKKCLGITINGKQLNPEGLYKVGTNNYMAYGGDGYDVLKKAINLYDTSIFQRDIFVNYLKRVGKINKLELKSRYKTPTKSALDYESNYEIFPELRKLKILPVSLAQ